MAALAVLAGSPAWAAPAAPVEQGWKPLVQLVTDGGNEGMALQRLRRLGAMYRTFLADAQVDPRTREFTDNLWVSFEAFALEDFYQLLPERSGRWKVLHVYGAPVDDGYRVAPDAPGVGMEASSVGPQSLGETHTRVRMKETEQDGRTSYLLDTRMRAAVGPITDDSLQSAYSQTVRNWVGDHRHAGSMQTASLAENVRKLSAPLAPEEVEILAPLWRSFPKMWAVFARIAWVTDVVANDTEHAGVEHVRTVLKLDPEKMRGHYPDLAEHLEDLGRLFHVDVALHGERGRLLNVIADSQALRLELEAYVKDGRLMPVENGRVRAPADAPAVGSARQLSVRGQGRFKLYGIETRLREVRTQLRYRRTAEGALVTNRMTRVPRVEVDGNAFGFMPSAVIDAFIPGDMQSVMEDFIATACRGNGGQGIVSQTRFVGATDGESARVETRLTFEALSSFFVRMGMRMANTRAIPDDATSQDIGTLFEDLQRAYRADLKGFARTAGLRSASVEGNKAFEFPGRAVGARLDGR